MGDIVKMSSKSETGTGDKGDASVTLSVDGDERVDLYLGVPLVLTAAVIPREVVVATVVGVRMRFDRAVEWKTSGRGSGGRYYICGGTVAKPESL